VVLAIAAIGVFLYGGSAHAEPTPIAPTPIVVEPITQRAAFTEQTAMQFRLKIDGQSTDVIKTSDPSNIVTTKITVQPGAQFPWHTHHGPVLVTVLEGEMTYVLSSDCVGHRHPAGTAFVDQGHDVHTAYSSSKTVTVLLATFLEVPSGTAPLSIPADTPANCKIPTS
jgi:predicted metal-dependent enzyme (double-stranded beta helix superfamily)